MLMHHILEKKKMSLRCKMTLFCGSEGKSGKHTAGMNKSVSSATSALTMKSKPCVQVSNWHLHLLSGVSQVTLISLKWIIKSYRKLLSHGMCHSCQMFSSSDTACLARRAFLLSGGDEQHSELMRQQTQILNMKKTRVRNRTKFLCTTNLEQTFRQLQRYRNAEWL